MLPSTTPQLRRMIEDAMRERASAMYRRLLAENLLEREVSDRVEVAREAKELAIGAPGSPFERALAFDGNPLQKQAMAAQATSQAWEQALAVALEFPGEDPAEGERLSTRRDGTAG
jgi:hypothetical protein